MCGRAPITRFGPPAASFYADGTGFEPAVVDEEARAAFEAEALAEVHSAIREFRSGDVESYATITDTNAF